MRSGKVPCSTTLPSFITKMLSAAYNSSLVGGEEEDVNSFHFMITAVAVIASTHNPTTCRPTPHQQAGDVGVEAGVKG